LEDRNPNKPRVHFPRLPSERRKKMRILKTQTIKRGFGSATAALFKSENSPSPSGCNGWDYVEVGHVLSEYQRDVSALSEAETSSLLGREVIKDGRFEYPVYTLDLRGTPFHVLPGKWHTPKINEDGMITSLIS
jgi:hypothetical protein